MTGEFNELNINNANITFNKSPNNIALSDELSAPIMYQDTMGTEYSKKKAKTAKKITVAMGITLLATASAIQAGTFISNGFVLNPPSISEDTYAVNEGVFSFAFSVTNKGNYKVIYYIDVNKTRVYEEECSVAGTYQASFSDYTENDSCEFYIQFTNRLDYRKNLRIVKFNKGGIIK